MLIRTAIYTTNHGSETSAASGIAQHGPTVSSKKGGLNRGSLGIRGIVASNNKGLFL
jgi:hypothetical protein